MSTEAIMISVECEVIQKEESANIEKIYKNLSNLEIYYICEVDQVTVSKTFQNSQKKKSQSEDIRIFKNTKLRWRTQSYL